MAKLNRTSGQFNDDEPPTINGSPMSERDWGMVQNALLSRSNFIKSLMDPRRDIDDECGYPETESLGGAEFRVLFDRESVATRVVEVLPKESWQTQPTVFETEEIDNTTPFETAWEELAKGLRGNSWYQDNEGNPIWEHLLRADILSGISSFGVLLLGFDGEDDLDQPVQPRDGTKLLFLRSFDESLVQISSYESDPLSSRFSQPNQYTITFNDLKTDSQSGIGVPIATKNVHWSRVIHLADNLGSSEIFGVPRMLPVYNRLYDLRKLYSGSAEMYWKGAFPGISLETNPSLGGDVDIDKAAVRGEMENYMNGLQRYLALQGMTAKSLAPQVSDPTAHIDTQLEAICIRLAIPKRIFTGSERGDLASSQDDSTWNDRLRARQNNYITPRVIVPFIDRLIHVGVLPKPTGYSIVWPDLDSLTALEQAEVAAKRTDALVKYVQGDVLTVVTPLDFLTRVLGFKQEEAEAIVEAAAKELEDEERLGVRLDLTQPEDTVDGTTELEDESEASESGDIEPAKTEKQDEEDDESEPFEEDSAGDNEDDEEKLARNELEKALRLVTNELDLTPAEVLVVREQYLEVCDG